LRQILGLAANWSPERAARPLRELLADPHVARYVEGWGRPGDTAVIAEDVMGHPVGAAWYRFFEPAAPGYGFVDAATPELTIGVLADFQGRGVGGALLGALLRAAAADGLRAVSLSVEPHNPARRLYERYGFVRVGVDAGSWTMRRELGEPRSD
jgi:ribosomal protein S18 acetylase RimI-like enzyme